MKISEERIKQIWGEITRKHQFTDGAFRVAFVRAIEKEIMAAIAEEKRYEDKRDAREN